MPLSLGQALIVSEKGRRPLPTLLWLGDKTGREGHLEKIDRACACCMT